LAAAAKPEVTVLEQERGAVLFRRDREVLLGPMIRRSAAVSSTPPGARASARTLPVTSTDVSWVSRPNASHADSGTSFFDTTTWRYPVPSRSITNPILPEDRVVITQPRVISVWPASGGSSSMRWKSGMGAGC